jgi:hypothetical protein
MDLAARPLRVSLEKGSGFFSSVAAGLVAGSMASAKRTDRSGRRSMTVNLSSRMMK